MASEPGSPRRFTFGISALLGLMVWVGIVSAALSTPTSFWAGAVFAIALMALFTSVLVIVYRDRSTRAFAVGFLVFGGGYLSCVSLFDGLDVDGPGAEKMITSRGVGRLYLALQSGKVRTVTAGGMGGMGGMGEMSGGMGGMGGGMMAGGAPATFTVNIYPYSQFHVAAQSALTVLIGIMGGIIAQLLYVTRRE